MATTWQSFGAVPKAAIWSLAIGVLAALGGCVWRAGSFRKRAIVFGGAVVLTGLAATAVVLAPSRPVEGSPEPGIGIRREGDRLFAEAVGSRSWPVNVFLPPNAGELLPESETRFFERLSGNPIIFSHDAQGQATRLIVYSGDDALVYEKTSDQPPQAVEPLKPRVAIELELEALDAFVGRYEFAPGSAFPAGIKVRIWREADQLLWQERGRNAIPGAIEIYPESPTSFFTKIDATRLTFPRNVNGEVTAVILHLEGSPDLTGNKVAND
jgi:hypothetical protein